MLAKTGKFGESGTFGNILLTVKVVGKMIRAISGDFGENGNDQSK